jgi:hypothetical protein
MVKNIEGRYSYRPYFFPPSRYPASPPSHHSIDTLLLSITNRNDINLLAFYRSKSFEKCKVYITFGNVKITL